jgi:hypothetical protein
MAQFRPAAYALGPLTVRWNRRVHEASPTVQEQTAAGQRALRLIADGFVLHDEIIFHFTDASPNTTAYRYWCGVSAMDLHVGSCWLRPTSHAFVLQSTHAQRVPYTEIFLPEPACILCTPEDVDEAIEWFLMQKRRIDSTFGMNPNHPPLVMHVKMGCHDASSFGSVYERNSPGARLEDAGRTELAREFVSRVEYSTPPTSMSREDLIAADPVFVGPRIPSPRFAELQRGAGFRRMFETMDVKAVLWVDIRRSARRKLLHWALARAWWTNLDPPFHRRPPWVARYLPLVGDTTTPPPSPPESP